MTTTANRADWTPEIEARLGMVPDRVIAEELEVSVSAVAHRRRSLGIRPWRRFRRIEWTDDDFAQMGNVSDRLIARAKKCTEAAVRYHRKRLGRPAYGGD